MYSFLYSIEVGVHSQLAYVDLDYMQSKLDVTIRPLTTNADRVYLLNNTPVQCDPELYKFPSNNFDCEEDITVRKMSL
jgi:hypothetical protein